MEPTCGLREPVFQKTFKNGKVCLDCAGVYRLHMSPSCEALRAPQKTKKKESLFPMCFFEGANTKMCEKMVPKCLQKADFISGVSQKTEAKKLKMSGQGTKSDPKRVPKPLKLTRNCPGFYSEVSHKKSARNPGPADCAKRLQYTSEFGRSLP